MRFYHIHNPYTFVWFDSIGQSSYVSMHRCKFTLKRTAISRRHNLLFFYFLTTLRRFDFIVIEGATIAFIVELVSDSGTTVRVVKS